MERGLKSADPKDCTAYTGWAGRAAERVGRSSSPGLRLGQTVGVWGSLNDHVSRSASRTGLLRVAVC